jgi:hypothetical protein
MVSVALWFGWALGAIAVSGAMNTFTRVVGLSIVGTFTLAMMEHYNVF